MYSRILLIAAAAALLIGANDGKAMANTDTGSVTLSEQSVLPAGRASTYVIREGDTLTSIASAYGLQLSTLIWANHITDKDRIEKGQVIYLLPVDGVLHRAEQGQTLDEIADAYGIDLADIMAANPGIDDHEGIEPGSLIIVPGARPLSDIEPETPSAGRPQRFVQPVSRGRVTSRYGYRVHPISRGWKLHTGLDIAVAQGTSIKAARDGKVVFAGVSGGYGNLVVLDHGGGLRTRYGHNAALLVKAGTWVKQGQVIAKSGSTGNSTGPHLHFEVRKNGRPVNPTPYLKGYKV